MKLLWIFNVLLTIFLKKFYTQVVKEIYQDKIKKTCATVQLQLVGWGPLLQQQMHPVATLVIISLKRIASSASIPRAVAELLGHIIFTLPSASTSPSTLSGWRKQKGQSLATKLVVALGYKLT